jgi:hypothetical protein
MTDAPEEVAWVLDTDEDPYWTYWSRALRCERCGDPSRRLIQIYRLVTHEERLYCGWECVAPDW